MQELLIPLFIGKKTENVVLSQKIYFLEKLMFFLLQPLVKKK